MKNLIDKMAIYTATILLSALPLSVDALDLTDESKKQSSTLVKNKIKTCLEHQDIPIQMIEVNKLKSRFERKIG